MKFLCWIPVVGILFEGMYLEKYNRNYLADPTHTGRFIVGVLWHGISCSIIIVTVTNWLLS